MNKFEIIKQKVIGNGWSVDIVDAPSEAWWALETWKLTSMWSPVGKSIFLIMTCDPQSEEEDTIEEKLLSILVSDRMPKSWDDGIEIYIRARWERGFEEFCEALPEFRTLL